MSNITKPDKAFDQWQTETKKIPTYQMNEQGKLEVGERITKQRYMLTELIPHQFCDAGDHSYQPVNGGRRQGGRILVKCEHCSLGRVLIPGISKLEDGKLLPYR